jgi:2-polyprenyl-3-methyl-5-hydroxy-6-metoxy-1,4-benzoquinol methylase
MEQLTERYRFSFGKNWKSFLSILTEEHISEAQNSLLQALNLSSLKNRSFVDIGCGSGLFSLAAMRLGAKHVSSFDYDPMSTACAFELKRHYYPHTEHWSIKHGSALDKEFLDMLGEFDIVYAWGVLHHTGNMRKAMENIVSLVGEDGQLYISIYNDQGIKSRLWRYVKKTYCSGLFGKVMVVSSFIPYFAIGSFVVDLMKGEKPLDRYRLKYRGMSTMHDWSDWLGGYPFEVAKPEEIFNFYRSRGFELAYLKTCGGKIGCNEFVFRRKRP